MLQSLGPWQYRIEDRLGGGGLAQAYRCIHPDLPGKFAIKILKNPTHVNTLLREVRALIALDGFAGVPALIDHGRDQRGQLCMVTTLMPGVRLDHHVRRTGPLSSADTLGIVQQLLDILQHAHSKGLLHKDIKHSNILLEGHRVSLIDWGASEFTHELPSETLRAKSSYMAPECYFGQHGPGSDFYSLGWLAVYLATGREPFHCSEVKDKHYWAVAHLLEQPRWPRDLPREVSAVALQWLARSPSLRNIAYDLTQLKKTCSSIAVNAERETMEFEAIVGQDYLLLGAEHGATTFQCELANRLLDTGQPEAALAWLEAAAKQGYPRAQRLLAKALPDDAEHACRKHQLLQSAAEAGSPAARYRLAKAMLRQGASCSPGSPTRKQLEFAASTGQAGALVLLARHLPPLSCRLALELAAESGHPAAIKALQKQDQCKKTPDIH
ncbi:serine/threonine protein kinase [Acidovorax kalamii]|uniref:serine/threonine protein kinase n=1 Tax=Acidovorax kalamii TaxID=2004485 RepID=UPI002091404B|nr:serine/threonine-protein kinase [Acidovorax kalamii]MCO5355967.1 serine/threonine protein kinase [Acidovorax kalamii]